MKKMTRLILAAAIICTVLIGAVSASSGFNLIGTPTETAVEQHAVPNTEVEVLEFSVEEIQALEAEFQELIN